MQITGITRAYVEIELSAEDASALGLAATAAALHFGGHGWVTPPLPLAQEARLEGLFRAYASALEAFAIVAQAQTRVTEDVADDLTIEAVRPLVYRATDAVTAA